MHITRSAPLACIFLSILLFANPCVALYDFEGLAFRPAAQGEVVGDVVTAGEFGLNNPPMECRITIDRAPDWARIYCGVWGGTERYSGWAQFTVNGRPMERITLHGQDDIMEGTYCAGHGVYWIAKDVTDLLVPGENTVTVSTSKGEPGNKIDGRIYAVMVVAAIKKDGGDATRYVVLEGNENLHGEGWSGANPTRRDRVEVPIGGIPADGVKKAELSVLLVATNRGQPDYILFNGDDLGTTPATGSYLPGAKDIGNERSYDATGGVGVETRYVDKESFDVTGMVRENNLLVFERGRDIDGDGNISTIGATPEGEDYIHPVLAILTVRRQGNSAAPALSVDSLEVANAYAGGDAAISAVVRNTGSPLSGPVTVRFMVDGDLLESREVTLPPEGWMAIAVPWEALEGTHVISVEASGKGALTGKADKSMRVGTPPDLVVSVGQPVRKESVAAPHPTTPFPLAGLAGASVLGWWLYSRKVRAIPFLLASAVIAVALLAPIATAEEPGKFVTYTLPIGIRNAGGSGTPAFEVTVLLDGEKVTVLSVAGVPAGGTIREEVSLYAMPGTHSVSVIADEKGVVPEQERGNNRADARFEFP